MKLGFIGLGKLGLPMAFCLAEGGNTVYGVDYNMPAYSEPDLIDAVDYCENLHISNSYDSLPKDLDAIVILVNTPEIDGKFSLCQIESVLTELTTHLDTLIILCSTVSPGSCKLLKEKYQLSKLAYVPDFVALGQVVEDFQFPEVCIVSSDESSLAREAAKIITTMHLQTCDIHYLTFEDAELAKILLNNYIALKISFANLIDQLTDNPKAVAEALGSDPRIGSAYLKPGLPWGGQCFPRDVEVMSHIYRPLASFVQTINDRQYLKLLDYVIERIKKDDYILVLGMGFKPDTNCRDHSFGVWLVEQLKRRNYPVVGWDRYDNVPLEQLITQSDTVIITHDDNRLRNYNFEGKTVLDLWRREQ